MHSKQIPTYVPEEQRSGWPAIILQIAAATLVSGSIVYVATNPTELVQAGTTALVQAVTPQVPAPPAVVDVPVQVANPFDKDELFQFPSGTSEAEARRKVADFLLQRARDRRPSLSKAPHQQTAPLRAP